MRGKRVRKKEARVGEEDVNKKRKGDRVSDELRECRR